MRKSTNLLTVLVLAALVLGALIGQFFLFDADASPERVAETIGGWKIAGDLVFIRPLTLLIIPLVFTSVFTGITSIGDPKRLGVIGGATLVFYVTTMIFAVAIGVTLASTFEPGSGIPESVQEQALAAGQGTVVQKAPTVADGAGLGSAWLGILEQMIPKNIVASAASGTALSIITATIFLAIGVIAVGEKAKAFSAAVEGLHEVLMRLVEWILWAMPLGVFFLVAWAVGGIGVQTLAGVIGKYVALVLVGLTLHAFGVLPLVLYLLARINPFKYMWSMRPALLTAFSTSSSMATLPVTIETAAESGCSRRSAGVVLPLGATVNMDGTALYQGITVIFLFQAFGYDLAFAQYLVIVLTATLSAVGAAGVPGGGLATILIIINAVNLTMAGQPDFEPLPLAAIGLYLPVDRILDMCRTTVNVWGDSVGARVITRLAPDTEESREEAFG